jgi:hypothetical protein
VKFIYVDGIRRLKFTIVDIKFCSKVMCDLERIITKLLVEYRFHPSKEIHRINKFDGSIVFLQVLDFPDYFILPEIEYPEIYEMIEF